LFIYTVKNGNRILGFSWKLSFLKLEEPIAGSGKFCTLPMPVFFLSPAWKSFPRSAVVVFSMLGNEIFPLVSYPGNLSEDSRLGTASNP
jgi:hypothetical protein